MADKKISQLTSLAPALGTDELPINRSNASGKLTVSEILVPEAAIRAAKDGDLTTLTTTAKTNLVSAINEVNSGLATKIPTSYLDADTSLTANSDSKIATQKATKAYVLANVTPSATETVQGKAEIATQTETNTGTDDVRFITPLKLKTNLATYSYLTGSGSVNYFPKYTGGSVLGNSALAQSATGNRILVNGVTDDTATAFQVSGSIRQTTVTTKIAALDANGKIVSGGSGTANYLTKWSATNGITSSLIQDNGTSVGILTSPVAFSALSLNSSTLAQNIYSLNSYVDPTPSFGQINYGLYQTKTGANTGYNVAGYFQATGASTGNYAVQLNDGSQSAGRVLGCVDSLGNANWVEYYKVQTILANPAFTNQAISIDFNSGNYVIIDYSSSITMVTSTNAVTFSNMKQGRIYKIKVKQGTSSAGETYTPTFAGMKWPGGTAFTPTTGTGKIDFIEVWYDGVNYYGDFIKNYA